MSQRGIVSVRHFVGFLVAVSLVFSMVLPTRSLSAQTARKGLTKADRALLAQARA